LGEFIGRAWGDTNRSLLDRQVKLTGFAIHSKKRGQWYLTRMQLRCCAADAFPLKVAVLGVPAPRDDTWVEVTGAWVPTPYDQLPKGTVAPELRATAVVKVKQPDEPYE
ncbi:TIGR03943 family protein, partial [Sphaerisporangium sp. NPDC049002]